MHKNEHHPYEYTDSLTSLSPKANLSQKKNYFEFQTYFDQKKKTKNRIEHIYTHRIAR